LVPTLTFIATVNPVMYCSARPFFLDCEGVTFNLDPEKLLCAVKKLARSGPTPKAVIVAHLYGHPCDMDPIMEVAKQYGMVVIEDATEAIGAKYKGKSVGRLGDIGCFSFNGNKLVTSGGGGMLVTDLSEYAQRARYLTTQARDDKFEFIHHEVGYNYRLTNLQAAVGLAQLEKVHEFIEKKKAIASYYQKHLKGMHGIRVAQEAPWADSSFWLVPSLVDTEKFGMSSRDLCHFLSKQSIESRPFFCPLHRLYPFREFASGPVEIADRVYEQGLLLPSSLSLTESDLSEVVDRILQVKLKDHYFPEGERTIWQPYMKRI
jgi:dTDP-4-amino-4,6-dideoxygalactose transaminase